MQSDKPFQTRVVLLDRENIVSQEPLATFVDKHGFRRLSEDGIAANPNIYFRVEAYEAQEDFKTTNPYRSRLLWRGPEGQSVSKLLLAPLKTPLP